MSSSLDHLKQLPEPTRSARMGVGDVYCRRDGDDTIIDRADPRVWIAAELLEDIAEERCLPWATLDGDTLTLHGSNRKVIYRITGYDLPADVYLAEWPD